MVFTYTQKVAILKSLLDIVDADGIRSIEEKQFLRAFSLDQDTRLEELMEEADKLSKEDMHNVIHGLDETGFREVQSLWYICSLSDGIVPEELTTIINLMNPNVEHNMKSQLSEEDISYIIDTYDSGEEIYSPSQEFLMRYNKLKGKLDKPEIEDRYYNSKELLGTLDLFGFDFEEFWYLVLFVKDVVEEKCQTAMCHSQSVYETIQAFRDAVKDLDKQSTCREFTPEEELPEDAVVRFKKPVTLTLQEGKSDRFHTLSNQAIYLMAHACDHLLKDHNLEFVGEVERVKMTWTKKITMFYVVMHRFLEGKEPKTKQTARSYDRDLLIARVLCAIGWIGPDKAKAYSAAYDGAYNPNRKLRNLVKNYKNNLSDGVSYGSLFYRGVKV